MLTLINPPSPFLVDERVMPNLALLYISTSWRENDINNRILDLAGDVNWRDTLRKEAKSMTTAAFSTTSSQFHYVYEANRILKEANPNIKTVVGGSHPTAISSLRSRKIPDVNIKPLEEFDVIVEGEAENLFNFCGKWVKTSLVNVNKIPIPDRSLIDIESYKYKIEGRNATTIMTQRGCPFNCVFCCGRHLDMYRKSRQRKPRDVLREMDYLYEKFGYDAFMWYDDEINLNPKRLKELSKLLSNRHYIHRGFIRNDLLVRSPKTIEYLKDMGFVELCSGVESGSDRILNIIQKHTTYNMNLKAARMIMDAGIKYKAFTMVGHPSETTEDVMLTIKWLRAAKPDGYDVTLLQPLPGSVLYDSATPSKKYGGYGFEFKGLYFNKPDFSKGEHFYKGRAGEYTSIVRTDDLTAEDFVDLRDLMEGITCHAKVKVK